MGSLVTESVALISEGSSIGQTLAWATALLKSGGVDTPRLDAECLLASLLHSNRLHLYLAIEERLPPTVFEAYRTLVWRRQARAPLAYLTGTKEFWSLSFKVTPAVLVPRPETEVLVEAALTRLKQLTAPVIVDVGTGSGAIAVALAKMLPCARIYATEISREALEVARENASVHGVVGQVAFLQGDLLEPLFARDLVGQCDLIVSNPPYVATADLAILSPEVHYEPVEALDGGSDGLRYHRQIIAGVSTLLRPRGWLALEMAPEQGSSLVKLLRDRGNFADVEVIPDLSGRQRMIMASSTGPGFKACRGSSCEQDCLGMNGA
ncbi:MAG: peptide chain release factor N(5)-glutamine methyltransferase [Candidatus Methylomirabilales bacterium]